jgi:hypothetical protein
MISPVSSTDKTTNLPSPGSSGRMETPVLYFYAPRELTAAAEVCFPQGVITEWYPQAKLSPIIRDPKDGSIALRDGVIAWPQVTVSPGAAPEFRRVQALWTLRFADRSAHLGRAEA